MTCLTLKTISYKMCLKSLCTASKALLALIEVHGLLRQILHVKSGKIQEIFGTEPYGSNGVYCVSNVLKHHLEPCTLSEYLFKHHLGSFKHVLCLSTLSSTIWDHSSMNNDPRARGPSQATNLLTYNVAYNSRPLMMSPMRAMTIHPMSVQMMALEAIV